MSIIFIQFLLLVTMFVQLDCEVYQDRPKIKSSDGNLILQAAYDKNIYLQPNGPQSAIFAGEVNLLHLNISKATIDHRSFDDYQSVTTASNDILQRLERLESLVADLQFNVTRVLYRKVNRLSNRISTLQLILNSPRDDCQSQPCQHGGTCLNLMNGYHCLCPTNWEDKNCETDVNECRNFAGTDLGCQNGATCINRPGSYECLCRSGWFGMHCTRKAKDCQQGDSEMCGHGTCIKTETGEGIKCICDQGWTTNSTGVMCLTDVNECDSSQGPRCSVNPKVDCINLPGSFRCGRCPTGYDGDGFICYDIDECLTIPNGGCSTSPMVTCHNTIGSRVCGSCPPGFEGDGVTCTWRGSCFTNRGGCHPSARCIDSSSLGLLPIAQCICPEGMIGNGIGIHGCYVPIGNNVTLGCEGNPCGPNGHCHSLLMGYTCICSKGYKGAHCDNNDNVCSSNPCLNGGTCRQDIVSETGFRCECTALFSGVVCQVHSKPCGGVLDNEEGSIIYPTSNSTYNHNARCAWVIHTAPDKVINVTFSKFNLEDNIDCSYDFLQIHDGRSSASQLIGRFCGNSYPKGGHIVSSHNNLYFWFRSDRSVAKEGFALHWSSVKPTCGGEIDATTHGYISSPGWPGTYPPNRDCYWLLTTSLGKRIQLHFFAFDIESYPNCTFDYVAIYDGQHTTDTLLNKFCNSTQPAPLQSAGSELLVHFHSDEHGSGNGFQIAFAPADGVPGCGGYYTSDKGEITSPSYNKKYLNNLNCEYKIKTGPNTKIRYYFYFFRLEESFRCRYDHLKIYDGPTSDSRLIGKYCGNTYPNSSISSSNALFLQFKTDHSMSSEGFKLIYESICHITILGDSGILKSPGYPFTYPNNVMCEYIITTRPGRSITLTFQDFDIEDNRHFNCLYDYVEVRDGIDRNATLLGKFCGGSGRIPSPQTSSLNYMYIRFKSDQSISGTGFYANYTTVEIMCGGIYKETSGMINYPSSGDTYNNDDSCTWILIAPEGMHIMVTWNRFQLEEMSRCYSDYVELIEIDVYTTNTSLGKYCGSSIPPTLSVLSNRLMIKFVSDSSIKGSGFSLSYTFLDQNSHCDGFYVKTHGWIYSPGWPRLYEPNRDCIWKITVPVGQQILLNITNFDLERPLRDRCDLGDYLEIRNGISDTAPLIGKYCGDIPQKQIISTANSIYLHFHSDFYLSGKGFQIEWDGTITGCGGTLTSYSGSISSPNYPEDYNESAECFYKIVTSSGSRIRIKFIDLQLEIYPDCSNDYVEIFDGKDSNSPSLGKLCQMMSTVKDFETTSNYAFIKFRSDFSINGKGFLINYETICNNNISGAYGVIESPGFPGKYPTNVNCLWTVTVPKGNKINVTFTHFDIHVSLRSFYPGSYYRRSSYSHGIFGVQPFYSSEPFYSPWRSWRPNRFTTDSNCDTDYLQTKDTLNANFTSKQCGSVIPHQIHTETNFLQIKFVTGHNFPQTGFRLEWVKYGCGGHIQKRFGTLKLDRNFIISGEMECDWLIESPEGTSISLFITEIVVTESTNCSIDALEIYNGQSDSFPLITKICHRGTAMASSTGNLMYVKFIKKSSLRDIYFISKFDSFLAVNCGGKIKSPSGLITSKNYPKNYDNNLDCIWFITVPLNHRIELNIIDFDLYSSSTYEDNENYGENCDDYINIYDGGNIVNSNYTYRICPQNNTSQIVTKKNYLALQFITDSYGTAKGFKANFTTTCGAIIDAVSDGIIRNDKYISYNTKNCTWTILALTLDQKIKLTITHMSIPRGILSNKRCPTSFLKVFDGNDDTAPLIGEYCGRLIPPMLVSHGSAITIQFGTYKDTIDGEFSAHYSSLANACGGTLTSEEGHIASPNYPLSYPMNTDCEWTISTSPGNRVYITFENFELEDSERCNEDYLEVRENNGGGKILGVFCGNSVPSNTTAATKLYIKFHSDNKNYGKGFVARYGFIHGNDITGLEAGEITSPLYPHPFDDSGKYSWRIITNGSGTITISLDHLEIVQQNNFCNSYLAVYDGYDDDAPVLDKLCEIFTNNLQTKVIKTTSTVAYITLVLDVANTGTRFHLTWTKSDKIIESVLFPNTVNCGSNITELISSGNTTIFTSPGYPNSYEHNLNCEWVFKSELGRQLLLIFLDISIENTPACYADYLSVYSSNNLLEWSPIKEHICLFDSIQNNTFTSSYLKVTFNSDSAMSRKGFRAKVKSVCGGRITEQSGIVNPTWLDMRNNLVRINRCDWIVKVRAGRNVMLKFDHFNITNNEKECSTYVMLRNGESSEAPLLAKYCGYEHESRNEIVTSSNTVYVTYVTYQSLPFQNFILHYEEKNIECGGTSKLNTIHKWEIISSPNYPSVPIPYTECIWIFTGPPGEILRVDFIERFDLQGGQNWDSCSQEFVEIRDGSSENSPLKGRFCKEKPGTIKTSNNYMYIKYVTSLTEPRDGFKANISIDLCGGTIVAESGELTSPGYPNFNLPYGTICEWHIISNPRRIIQLQFKDIYLPESESPCATKVEVVEPIPANKSVTILKTLCDENETEFISDPIITFINEVIIRLHIGKPTSYFPTSNDIRFRLAFNSSRPSCGGLITTPEGFLTTPGYPHETTVGYCQWIILVPNEKRRVRLEIIDVNVNNQRLSFYNDKNFRTVIQRISGKDINNMPQFIESTGNKMALYLFAKPLGALHRFKAKYSSNEEILCGGELSGLTGHIKSPNFDRPYTCEWKYSNVDNSDDFNNSSQYNTMYINVKINSSLTLRNLCRFSDSVVSIIAEAPKARITYSRATCRNNTDVSYRFPFTSLQITSIQSDHFPLEFYLEWHRQPCGGIVNIGQDTTNIFNVPVNYTGSVECGWILVIPSGIRLEIKIEGSFLLDCANEYLQISQGLNQFTAVIGDYCKDRMPNGPLSTSFMHTYIEYHSKAPNVTAIKVLARTISDQCGGFITKNNRVFASPNYPKGYENNLECTWEIQSDVGNRISLAFIDRFAIEDTTNCSKDAIIIYDWKNNEYTEMARICGRRLPDAHNSTGNKMKVTLRTDDAIYLDGFKAQWNPICGGKFLATDKEQFIYSPGYPYEYSSLLECNYEISGSEKILLKFEDFELEGTYPNCNFDNVTIIGRGRNNYLYEIYCGKQLPKPMQNFDNIKLLFKTDRYTQRKGFKLSYSIFSCGEVVKEPTLITPGDLDSYDNNMNCSWVIEAPVNKIVVFKFLYVELENNVECYNDYVGIFDGEEPDLSKRIALLCGYFNTTKTIRSIGNKALLQFISDSSLNYKGFKVQIFFSYSESAGCGGRVNLTSKSSQVIKSPFINSNVLYESFLDCHWEVRTHVDHVIRVKFQSFHIAPCENVNQTALGVNNCDCDFVELRDGLNPNSFLIERYCGHNIPPPLVSSRNLLNIRLSTDGEINSSGFEVLLTAERSICGQTTIPVSHEVTRWSSPGYEIGLIPRGLHCNYDLDTSLETYTTVQITIHNLDIEAGSKDRCDKDRLVITGNSKPHNASLGQNFILSENRDDFFAHAFFYEETLHFPVKFELCKHMTNVDFYVQGSVSINLLTSADTATKNHKGVEIEVVYLGFCGRNYSGTHGRIQSTFDNSVAEGKQRDCYILITAPENHTISIYFMSVIPDYYNPNVFLEIHDGNNTNTNILLRITTDYTDSPVFSTGRYLLLHSRGHGFNSVTYDLNYVATDQGQGCGGKIYNIIGKVTSPLYPEVFRKKITCQWDIQTPESTRLMLRFSVFDLGRSCEQNYVELQDKNGNSLSKFCEERPADYISTDNFVTILFYTTMNNGGSGWIADFVGII